VVEVLLFGSIGLHLGIGLSHPTLRTCRSRCALKLATVHADWGDLTDKVLRLTDAQQAKTVAAACLDGTLCTELDVPGAEGAVFSSAETFVVGPTGALMFGLTSEQALHNLQSRKRATFHIRAPSGGAAAGSSISLIGDVEDISVDIVLDADLVKLSKVCGATVEAVAARSWRRLVPTHVHLSDAVRGREAWVPASEYMEATGNPLAHVAEALLKKMNGAHAESLVRFVSVYSGIPHDKLRSAELLGVDQLGFDLRIEQLTGPPSLMRVGFRLPPANEEEGVSVFMKLFQEAYEKQRGDWGRM